jgi:signal transduction histidine kinase
VRVHADLVTEPPPAAARAAYFVVSEGLSNVAKHAAADHVDVHLEGRADELVVRVVDDGRGGADPSGGGLSGLARRVAAVDGTLSVHSPPGGPTELTAVLPCG